MSKLLLLLLGLALLALDIGLRGLLGFGTIIPSLTLPFVVYLSLRRGSTFGAIAGFLIGLGGDIFGGSALGSSSLAMSLVGFLPGRFWQSGPFRVHWPWGTALLVSAVIFEAIRHMILSRELNAAFGMLFWTSGLPSAFYTMVLGILWFLSPLNRDHGS